MIASAILRSFERLHALQVPSRPLSSVADSMIAFVRDPSKKDFNESSDILKAGLNQVRGLEAGRLQMAAAELAFEHSKWADAAESSDRAIDCAREAFGTTQELRQMSMKIRSAAEEIRFRSLLAQGNNEAALQHSKEDISSSNSLPDAEDLQAAKWHSTLEAESRHAYGLMVAGHQEDAGQEMKAVMDSLKQQPQTEPVGESAAGQQETDNTLLPMQPGDVDICNTLLRCGAFQFCQGDGIAAGRYLQRAAMAAEAHAAQCKDSAESSGSLPVTHYLPQETSLAGFLGHVQIGFGKAQDMDGWKKLEMQLEAALGRAEVISGDQHPRVLSSLLLLGDVYAHTERWSFAEGLYRSASKTVYKNPSPPSPLTFIQDPSKRQHDSLACLLAWRYAQLLSVLPKRETEARHWKLHAEQLLATAGLGSKVEASLGDLATLKGKGEGVAGCFLDSSIRRVLPCVTSLMG